MPRHLLLIELAGDERTDSQQIFVENPVGTDIKKLLKLHVNDPACVEYAEIVEIKRAVSSWYNPDCNPEV